MTAKRQRSAPPKASEIKPKASESRPQRKIGAAAPRVPGKDRGQDIVDPVQDQLAFLEAREFNAAVHVPALYRLSHYNSLQHSVQPVRGKNGAAKNSGTDTVAEAIGFPSPFLAVNLGDRKGIWQSDAQFLQRLGADPQKTAREVVELPDGPPKAVLPAGLKNLGATCYLNSLLQYLFFNMDFRQHFVNAKSSADVVKALQHVFANMAASKHNEMDPSAFVDAAGLDAVEQEDAVEFSSLLLDWLERELNQGEGDEKGGAFIPALFQGEITQILTCLNNPEHRFERAEPFYELRARLTPDVGVSTSAVGQQSKAGKGHTQTPETKNAATIEDTVMDSGEGVFEAEPAAAPKVGAAKRSGSGKRRAVAPPPVVRLENLLQETTFPDESMDGSNQYHCPKCDRKVDARKSLRLAKPPPYLHITVERYHYDMQKGERQKLNNVVSFPRHLKMRLCPQHDHDATAAAVDPPVSPVTYECIGYLEHVSDCAHSGHYTATLYQSDAEAAAALSLAADRDKIGDCKGGSAEQVRADHSCGDAAAGAPRGGLWWTLDDSTVSAVTFPKPGCAANASAKGPQEQPVAQTTMTPSRLESKSAYLLLYRRSDCASTRSTRLPDDLQNDVEMSNDGLTSQCELYRKHAAVLGDFMKERRLSVSSLVKALSDSDTAHRLAMEERSMGTKGSTKTDQAFSEISSQLSIVPTAWLTSYLNGSDCSIPALVSGGGTSPTQVMYGPTLLRGAGGKLLVDPLAVWCGEVKIIPTAALNAFSGQSGLDPTLFVSAEEAFDPTVCEAAWQVAKAFVQEWRQIRKILKDAKVSTAEARSMQSKGRGADVCWVSLRLQKTWMSVAGGTADESALLPSAMMAFLMEVKAARFAGTVEEEPDAEVAPASAIAQPDHKVASKAESCDTNLLEGLLCTHGRVGRPRAGFLVRRGDLERLVELSQEKEAAYKRLWPKARVVPRLRTGCYGGKLMCFNDICSQCCGDGSSTTVAGPTALRSLVIRRRYPSGHVRKQGSVSIPDDGEPITASILRDLVKAQLSIPVSKLFIPEGKKDVELNNAETLGETVDKLIVEKDEAVQQEVAAFQGSIFRGGKPAGGAAKSAK